MVYFSKSSNLLTKRMHSYYGCICLSLSPICVVKCICPRGCIITLVAVVWLFSHVCLQMFAQTACRRGYINTMVAFIGLFSTVGSQDEINCLPPTMHSRIGSICLIFLHCVFSNVSTSCLGQRMQSHTGCTCLAFLRCVFSNVSSNCLNDRMQNRIGCICLTFLKLLALEDAK